ncbi:MAG: hypothetical protein IT449_11165 [Phycisphaerales bacterium]|nr:hypothetical protein [Phycisphaerales bacterium]
MRIKTARVGWRRFVRAVAIGVLLGLALMAFMWVVYLYYVPLLPRWVQVVLLATLLALTQRTKRLAVWLIQRSKEFRDSGDDDSRHDPNRGSRDRPPAHHSTKREPSMKTEQAKSEGACLLCGQRFSGRAMTRHVRSCYPKNPPPG